MIKRLNVERVVGSSSSPVPLRDGLLRFFEATPWPEGVKTAVKRLQRYWLETLKVNPEWSFQELSQEVQAVVLRGKAGDSSRPHSLPREGGGSGTGQSVRIPV